MTEYQLTRWYFESRHKKESVFWCKAILKGVPKQLKQKKSAKLQGKKVEKRETIC